MTERLPFHFSCSCTGEGNGNPLQCSCLENPRDGGARWAAVYGVTQSRTQLKRLSRSSSSRHHLSLGTKKTEYVLHRIRIRWEERDEQYQHHMVKVRIDTSQDIIEANSWNGKFLGNIGRSEI